MKLPSLANELPWPSSHFLDIPTPTAIMTATPQPGDNDGGHGGGHELQNWSSLIGIITAIVGNVLIALALNVQRYAHTRLHKERMSIRKRARAATKRALSGQSSTYGALGYGTNGNTTGGGHRATISDDDEPPHDSHETEPLTHSYNSGTTTVGEGNDEEDEAEAERQAKAASSYLKSPYWWLGQVLITLGEMGNFLAYGFAPASIVSPLGVVALISNCLIAPLMFQERFRQRDFWGVVVAVGGVVTVVLSAKTEETKLNPHDVWGAITTLAFEIYLGVTVFLIIVLMWASPRYGRQTILIDLGLVGLFGGYTALSTKGVSSMLSSTLWRAFTTPVTYVLVFILLGTAIMQIRYVNKALQRFESTQVIPIQFVMFTLCVILGSAILYRDFEKTNAEQAGKFVGGCLLTFFGVFLITSGRQKRESDEEEDALSDTTGVEETIGLDRHDSHQPYEDTPRRPSVAQSRRSSKHSRIVFPEGNRSQAPDVDHDAASVCYPTPGSIPETPGVDNSSLEHNPWDGPSPLKPPGRGIRTMSADMLMRGSAVMSTPTTPMRDGLAPPGCLERPTTPQGRAHTYHHRRSGTFISPSPLSSTVTTVMKDGFLRGDKRALATKSSMRHLRSRIRASLFFNEDGPVSEDNLARAFDDQEEPFRDTVDDEEHAGRMRSRSLSDALGDMFRPRRKSRKEDNRDVDHDDGSTRPDPSS